MKVRDVLEKLLAGQTTLDDAEKAILYQCEDCEELELDPDDDSDELPATEPKPPTVEQLQIAYHALPESEKQRVLTEMRKHLSK